ncbi:MAG: bifunctional DNA primase/polymerase, partial [Acidimicrobiia bacterium]|nr:bifunctional DNA primase/polymerase [Acidimicrobiia bacterium]
GGGVHLWFCTTATVPSVTLAAGVELKGEGGMVVTPPSRHASGARYRWRPGGEPGLLPLAPLPPWIAELAGAAMRPGVQPADHEWARTTLEQQEFARGWSRAGVELLPGDRYYRCPFHDDHHPSLHIDAEGCRWYCFGCGVGGGIGRLRSLLGDTRSARPRTRLRGQAGRGLPVTIHGAHEVDVVGESHHQDELLAITGGRRRYGGVDVGVVAELVPEPSNRFDPDAIVVAIDERPVGYVRHGDVEWLRPVIDESLDMHGLATCDAVIRGGWDRGRGEVGWFGVTLLLPHS